MPDNESNALYEKMNGQYAAIRNISQATAVLSKTIQPGRDFEKLENARLLDPSDYVLNEQLGYISLNTALNSDEVLAVAY